MTSPILASGLVRTFGSGDDEVRAVDGVDLEVRSGEIFGFLGPNGAGKSTTVRMLTTLLRPTGGSARVAGYDVVTEADAVRRNIGVALQDAAIDPLMTGHELLRLQAVLYGLPRGQHRSRADELLERVPMETATWVNELGAKGIGESGTIGSTPAVHSAVLDALSHLGVRHIDMPCTPERVWRAIASA